MKNTDTVTLKLTRKQANDIKMAIHCVITALNDESDADQAENALRAIENRWSPLVDAIANQIKA